MPHLPRRTAGPRAWWSDVAVSIAALGTAQAIVLGGDSLLDVLGRRPAQAPAFESALVLERAPGSDGGGISGVEPLTVVLDGQVDGLYPGASGSLPLMVGNPTTVTMRIERLTIGVGTPDRDGCPAEAILVGTPLERGSGTVDVALALPPAVLHEFSVPVAMATDAPESCQGATFPLRYVAEGVLP